MCRRAEGNGSLLPSACHRPPAGGTLFGPARTHSGFRGQAAGSPAGWMAEAQVVRRLSGWRRCLSQAHLRMSIQEMQLDGQRLVFGASSRSIGSAAFARIIGGRWSQASQACRLSCLVSGRSKSAGCERVGREFWLNNDGSNKTGSLGERRATLKRLSAAPIARQLRA